MERHFRVTLRTLTSPVVFALVFLLGVAGCDNSDDLLPTEPAPTESIAELAASSADLGSLVAALQAAGLADDLAGEGPFTVFAPVNSAFAGLGQGANDELLAGENEQILRELLTYHVISGAAITSDQLSNGQRVTALNGGTLRIGVDGSRVTVNGEDVVTADIAATNGVIHLIDGVLLSGLDAVQRANVTPQTSTLAAAIEAAELAPTLSDEGPFTIFAPVNSAFERLSQDELDRLLDPANRELLQKLLTYHVVSGDIRAADLQDGQTVTTVEGSELTIDLDAGATVNGKQITVTDIEVENGVIHLIDGVLTENLDIVDQATLKGFDTLVGAVEAAGLTETLRTGNFGEGFTVFAPTDEAFAALASIPSEPQVLGDILLYHVVGATVPSTALSDGQSVQTLEGGSFTVDLTGGVSLQGETNTVQVTVTDIPAANGIIHVIDAVLLPAND